VQELPKVATVFDSEEEHVGEVYAKALLGVARKAPNTDQILEQFQTVVEEVLAKHPKLEAALNSPKLTLEQKESLLEKILGAHVDPMVLKFIKILCRRQRLNFVRGIQRSVTDLRDVELGRLRVIVTSALALSESECDRIRTQLTAKLNREVSLVSRVDPSIVGGLVLRIGDTVFDGSVAGKFEQLLRATKQGSARALSRDSSSLVS
jgi:F-type H+-transporting ATPase subunit delta